MADDLIMGDMTTPKRFAGHSRAGRTGIVVLGVLMVALAVTSALLVLCLSTVH